VLYVRRVKAAYVIKLAFHDVDTDTDILADIFARIVGVPFSLPPE